MEIRFKRTLVTFPFLTLSFFALCNAPIVSSQLYSSSRTATYNNNGIMRISMRMIDGVEVPAFLSTRIHSRNIREPGDRADFRNSRSSIRQRWSDMQPRDRDDRGHLLASRLGGTGEAWNLAPQARTLNRRIGDVSVFDDWYNTEETIAQFLQHNCGYVDWDLTIEYNDESRPRRPSGFRLKVKAYDNQGRQCRRSSVDTYLSNRANQAGDVPRKRAKLGRRCLEDLCVTEGAFLFISWLAYESLSGSTKQNPSCPICGIEIDRRTDTSNKNFVLAFKDTELRGEAQSFYVENNKCLNLDGNFNNQISSTYVSEGSCVKFWRHEDCNGDYLKSQGEETIDEIGIYSNSAHQYWNDDIGSVSGCSYNPPSRHQPVLIFREGDATADDFS